MATRKKIPLVPSDATLTIGAAKTISSSVNLDVSGADIAIVGSGTAVITFPTTTSTLAKTTDIAPVGCAVDFAGSTAPTSWLICDGATVSQTTYAALYAVIGHTYGSDPGGGNFILPNCKGRVTVGLNSAETEFDALGHNTGGAKTVTLTGAESGVPAHNHPPQGGSSSILEYVPSGGNAGMGAGSNMTGRTTTGNNTAANAANAHNNLQPFIVFNKIIKY